MIFFLWYSILWAISYYFLKKGERFDIIAFVLSYCTAILVLPVILFRVVSWVYNSIRYIMFKIKDFIVEKNDRYKELKEINVMINNNKLSFDNSIIDRRNEKANH